MAGFALITVGRFSTDSRGCKNRATLIGFIGNDAETRFTASGLAQTRFSIATNARWKDRESGEYRTRTEWHRIVVWGKFAEWAGSLKKGAFLC
ncbi:MAG TPA: single-stranded DNA-binding protein [Bryobacteraceae bacterium]|nr:single-stranded DNA-binding protein [Bryobacteraceae bacterium]